MREGGVLPGGYLWVSGLNALIIMIEHGRVNTCFRRAQCFLQHARIFKGLIGDFQQEPLLRINSFGFYRADIEHVIVEMGDVLLQQVHALRIELPEDQCQVTRSDVVDTYGAIDCRGGVVERGQVEPVARASCPARLSSREHLPERIWVRRRSRQAARHAHDGHRHISRRLAGRATVQASSGHVVVP